MFSSPLPILKQGKAKEKAMKKLWMTVFGCILYTLPIWADMEIVGGFMLTYRLNGDTAEIYRVVPVSASPSPSSELTIPDTLGGKPVTSIGEHAFKSLSLTSVTIPGSVTSIGGGRSMIATR